MIDVAITPPAAERTVGLVPTNTRRVNRRTSYDDPFDAPPANNARNDNRRRFSDRAYQAPSSRQQDSNNYRRPIRF